MYLFFFLMIRRPPRSTLFPYTRSSDLIEDAVRARGLEHETHNRDGIVHVDEIPALLAIHKVVAMRLEQADRPARLRSEEHTSELQSRQYLVCRLLLEKKKTKLPSATST